MEKENFSKEILERLEQIKTSKNEILTERQKKLEELKKEVGAKYASAMYFGRLASKFNYTTDIELKEKCENEYRVSYSEYVNKKAEIEEEFKVLQNQIETVNEMIEEYKNEI
ncbi:hypothetical protein [Clostridium ganghwense]|uniref:DUF5082 domain-containing protein n=1 Tax=Clostridium ganghwense TaxID=312089 RepID=A0ABT4CUL2_9CLOT|nr:hypothetical protein [Clostridium ganghwense]MCY6372775.1 hypothetical protein [Clostridium ganghwense]